MKIRVAKKIIHSFERRILKKYEGCGSEYIFDRIYYNPHVVNARTRINKYKKRSNHGE